MTHKEQSVCSTIYVVKGLKTNLLGVPAITALNIVARVDTIDEGSIESQKEIILRKYPEIFRGLGNLGEAYTIKLRADAKPHALFTARKIPLPLRDRVKEELDNMTSMGVISKVEAWCQSQKRTGRLGFVCRLETPK